MITKKGAFRYDIIIDPKILSKKPNLRVGNIFLIWKRDSGFSLVGAFEAKNWGKYNYQPESMTHRKSCHFKGYSMSLFCKIWIFC